MEFSETQYKIAENGCWHFIGNTDKNTGYGMVSVTSRRNRPAHVIYFEHFKHKIPTGLVVHHKCKNRICVNPEHLECITNKLNVQLGSVAKITQEIADNIRKFRQENPKVGYRQIGQMFGLAPNTVGYIIRGKFWAK